MRQFIMRFIIKFLSLLCLGLATLRCATGQGDSCVSASMPMSGLARSCMAYYDRDDGFINGTLRRMIRMTLDNIEANLTGSCADMVQRYLCYFYWPRCDLTNGEVIPVCIDSCDSLFNNEECSSALTSAIETLQGNIRDGSLGVPSESCDTTTRRLMESHVESEDCITIEVPFIDDYDTDEDDENSTSTDDDSDTTIIIICAIVGGVITAIIIVLIIIIIVLVKRRRKNVKIVIEQPLDNNQVQRYTKVERHGDHLDLNYPSNESSPYLSHRNKVIAEEDSITESRSSLLEINQFLQYVKDKFSEVLLPAEVVTKLDFIGKGAFGIVHKGEMISSDGVIKAVAIKTIKSTSLDGMKDLVAETAIMKGFHHLNVLPLLGVCVDYDDEDVLKIVIPFMAHGDLRSFLKESRVSPNNSHEYPKDLNEEILKRMCLDIAQGMVYLADKRFVHRDLAARNCMVDERLRIKVADFGLTRDIYSTEYYRIENQTTLPVKWMALESLLDGYFDEKTDMWSYGVTCWEIFSLGRIPYPGVDNSEVIKTLKAGERLDKPTLCPSNLYNMLESTWQEEPDKRPSFADIVLTLSEGVEDSNLHTVSPIKGTTDYVDVIAQ